LYRVKGQRGAALAAYGPRCNVSTIESSMPTIKKSVAAFAKHVDDVVFKSQSDALGMAQQTYALLQRRAFTDTSWRTAMVRRHRVRRGASAVAVRRSPGYPLPRRSYTSSIDRSLNGGGSSSRVHSMVATTVGETRSRYRMWTSAS
jgi:hypothetical protein